MTFDISPVPAEEFKTFALAVEGAFGARPKAEEIENIRLVHEPERSLAAFDRGEIVGTAAAFTMVLTVPGAELPMAGVTAVGVAPTHRRRGILTSLMRRQLEDVRDAGEPMATLWASEDAIYGRFGYGAASLTGYFEAERNRTAFADAYERTGRMNLLEKERALEVMPPVYERVRRMWPGLWERTEAWWKHLHADLEQWRRGFSELFYAVHEGRSGPDGYVTYRMKSDWDERGPKGKLLVRELTAENPAAYATLWRYCFDMDLVATIEAWGRPVDEPLLHMLAEPRRLGFRISDGLWLRPVDTAALLAARRYQIEGCVRIGVVDAFCPWNEGTYELEAGPDGAQCRRVTAEPQLVAGPRDVGAAYLGGTRFRTLARAGRVTEAEAGALARADAMFGWDPLPWCSTVF